MTNGRANRTRSLANVRLTRKYHFPYMGLWMFISICLVLALNLVIYLYAQERWGGPYSLDHAFHQEYVALSRVFLMALAVEALCFIVATTALAVVTAHRIAGPFIRLQNTFHAVRDGDLSLKLKFRDYDHLEDVEGAFDEMMAALRRRLADKPEK
jgi:HAMP domain-containing protein